MIDTIYIEEEIKDHPRAIDISSRFKNARVLTIDKFGELFNKKSQSFRLQKRNPALILAKKAGRRVLPAPEGFGIGGHKNYYFSHMYNCLYDCSYCFLQGLYNSADYVVFVNYEDFLEEIIEKSEENPSSVKTFFSGYDCDSLAFDKITGFCQYFLPRLRKIENCEFELRTKSINIEVLKSMEPIKNCIIAFSLSPDEVAKTLDEKAPSIKRRLDAMKNLVDQCWNVGLRFDPLIYSEDWTRMYSELFDKCFEIIDNNKIHSVSFGPLRFPKEMYKKIKIDRPKDKLFIGPFEMKNGTVAYKNDLEKQMSDFCQDQLSRKIGKEKIFHCVSDIV